jgi:Flp pilus assembly protein CpaB
MKEPLCPPLCPSVEEAAPMVTEQRNRLATQLTVQDARVLGVGRWSYAAPPPEEEAAQGAEGEPVQAQPPSYITLMLTPQDALVLKMAREQGASIDLAVRAQDDAQVFATQQVTLDYILARFGVSLPAKQPYSIERVGATGGQ